MSKTRRVVVLTDTHLRSDYIPGFLDRQVDTLLQLVNSKPTDSVIINGDIFHKRNPDGDSLLAFDHLLDNFKCGDIYVNRGNHDTIHKDGSSETTLSLFGSKAKIVTDTETVRIAGVNFDFIPHYEDESIIVKALKSSKNHVFGHFGFDGCVSNGSYSYEAKVKRWHFPKKKYSFLGHIHKPRIYDDRIHVLGTQYSNSFGESNTQKFITQLIIRDGEMEIIRKPINFGIRHITCDVGEIDKFAKKYKFKDFFTILRVKLDRLDEYVERQIHERLINEYDVDYLELSFEDILPKFTSDYAPISQLISLDDHVISEYLQAKSSIFSDEELLEALKEIRNEN